MNFYTRALLATKSVSANPIKPPLNSYAFNSGVFGGGANGESAIGPTSFNSNSWSFWLKTSVASFGVFPIVTAGTGTPFWGIYVNFGRLVIDAQNTVDPVVAYRWDPTMINDGVWRHFVINRNTTGTPELWVNGSLETFTTLTGSPLSIDPTPTTNILIGSNGAGGTFNGEMGFVSAGSGFDITDAQNLYGVGLDFGGGFPPCYDELDTGTAAKLDSFWNLGNWTGTATEELFDQHSSNNLSPGPDGQPLYTGTGLTVQCF